MAAIEYGLEVHAWSDQPGGQWIPYDARTFKTLDAAENAATKESEETGKRIRACELGPDLLPGITAGYIGDLVARGDERGQKAVGVLLDALATTVTSRERGEWPRPIPVGERLPTDSPVLAWDQGEEWQLALYDKNGGFWNSSIEEWKRLDHVTHWMPLPPDLPR